MIKFCIHAIGKLKKSPTLELIDDYKSRIINKLEIRELELKKAKSMSIDSIKEHEADLLLSGIPNNSRIISMDERGELVSSKEFANYITQQSINGFSSFVFMIGGADGLHERVRASSHKIISLGRITLPHMLARLILVEQIYRAERIMNNHPYDKSE